jgi:uncharacterized Fe-S cluster protein YjdI
VKRYVGERIEVTYDAARCRHAAECLRGLPAVFDVTRRPWIEPDAADAEELAAVIRRCPTGALHYSLADGPPEAPVSPTRVRLPAGGPVLIAGDLEIDGVKETRAALCRCGSSQDQPFCDGSGECRDWHYEPGT